LPEIVQDIGAYAGIASVVGLALLSALYFSQARDVKRLREWAGRAPERSEQGTPAVPGRVVAQPQPTKAPTTPPQVPGKPVTPGKPAAATPAAAAAAGAGAATAQQAEPGGAPVPVGQNANAGVPSDGAAKEEASKESETAAQPAPAAAAAVASGAGAAGKQAGAASPQAGGPPNQPSGAAGTAAPTSPGAPSSPGGPSPGAPASPGGPSSPGGTPASPGGPSSPGGPTSPGGPSSPGPSSTGPTSPPSSPPGASRPPAPPPARPSSTPPRQAATPAGKRAPSVPAGEARFATRPGVTSRHSPQETAILPPRPKSRGGLTSRYLAVALVGLLVLGGAAAYGVTQLTGDDDGGTSSQSAPGSDDGSNGTDQPQRKQGAVKPGNVTVAVLNGTTVPGLAATLSDEVNAAGFKVGTITNFSDQQLAESVVQYASGHQAEARAVSRRLGIAQREPINPSSQALAGDATVIVIAGADKAP
jgi:hypothetical protein